MIPYIIKSFNYFITCYDMMTHKTVLLGSEIKKKLLSFEIPASKNPISN